VCTGPFEPVFPHFATRLPEAKPEIFDSLSGRLNRPAAGPAHPPDSPDALLFLLLGAGGLRPRVRFLASAGAGYQEAALQATDHGTSAGRKVHLDIERATLVNGVGKLGGGRQRTQLHLLGIALGGVEAGGSEAGGQGLDTRLNSRSVGVETPSTVWPGLDCAATSWFSSFCWGLEEVAELWMLSRTAYR
jgi:hypothetical protein